MFCWCYYSCCLQVAYNASRFQLTSLPEAPLISQVWRRHPWGVAQKHSLSLCHACISLLYLPVCSECPHHAISWVKWHLWPSSWQKLSNSLLNEQIKLHSFMGDEYCIDKYERMVTPHKENSTKMLAYKVEEGSMGVRKIN